MLTEEAIEDIGKEHAPYVDQKFARAIESAAIDAFLARTGKYLTNDASREAAIADATAPLLGRIADLKNTLLLAKTALEYHTQQTRPIHATAQTIAEIDAAIKEQT